MISVVSFLLFNPRMYTTQGKNYNNLRINVLKLGKCKYKTAHSMCVGFEGELNETVNLLSAFRARICWKSYSSLDAE